MLPPTSPPERPARLSDRLEAARRGRFVGRMAEIDRFRSAVLAAEPPFAVLHIHGPGGVGKSTLLREYARVAAESGRPVYHLDGRNVDPSPSGFLLALRQAMGVAGDGADPAAFEWPETGVLLIDTYETLAPLDAWLRETFLPGLPAQSLVVMAGRNQPAPAWRTDLDWAGLSSFLPLRNLRPEEGRTFLATRGVPEEQHAEVMAFTHGHPLALALVADALGRGNRLAAFDPADEPDIVRHLLERLVQEVPSAVHRRALETCVIAWATTEALLAEVLEVENAHELFDWLRGLSFVEQGPYGLFPHDLAREALDADLRWRNAEHYQDLHRRVWVQLRSQWAQATGIRQQRLRLDLLFINRHQPGLKTFFAWDALDRAYAEPASPDDASTILSIVRAHEGDASAQLAAHWLRGQPSAFSVFRTGDRDLIGFMANVEIHKATEDDLAVDPAMQAALGFAERHGPIKPDEEAVYLRFWMGRETYQAVSPAINLTAINSVNYWMTHPKLAWNFIAMATPDFWLPHFTSINIQRSPDADFAVDGRRFGVFTHDWRQEPADVWGLTPGPPVAVPGRDVAPPAEETPGWTPSRSEFAEAVRQALRDFSRPDRLATNPLLGSRMVAGSASADRAPAALQALLREAVASLEATPKDVRLHRALWHTYLEPAPTQEQAAELLDLPFNTYRYHLAKGIERITDWLWWREAATADR